jgi:hypothetical protein
MRNPNRLSADSTNEGEKTMKYLCLAYGDEKDWNVLTKK